METWKHVFHKRNDKRVLTVPMRNGNEETVNQLAVTQQFLPYLWGMETSLRPLVKCHKRNQFLPYLWGMETINIVNHKSHDYTFLPYLWGMETVSTVQLKERQSSLVLTVPMRNGNFYQSDDRLGWFPVLTVPMRNGNSVSTLQETSKFLQFLPYLWGMETIEEKPYLLISCWFLPYLWGMETNLKTSILQSNLVLTVPMRNGNISSTLIISNAVAPVLTVPMRNGNSFQ